MGDSQLAETDISTYIRNICAHHARLWNRECRIKPLIARAFKADLTPNERVYAQLVVTQIMLAKIAPSSHCATKLRELLAEHPSSRLSAWASPPTGRRKRSGISPDGVLAWRTLAGQIDPDGAEKVSEERQGAWLRALTPSTRPGAQRGDTPKLARAEQQH